MKWENTTASQCRYGEVAGQLWGLDDVIWENSVADWQGSAEVLVCTLSGKYVHYEWSYGSCSGCDDWEARRLSDDEIQAEMLRDSVSFMDLEEVIEYFEKANRWTAVSILKSRRPKDPKDPVDFYKGLLN